MLGVLAVPSCSRALQEYRRCWLSTWVVESDHAIPVAQGEMP